MKNYCITYALLLIALSYSMPEAIAARRKTTTPTTTPTTPTAPATSGVLNTAVIRVSVNGVTANSCTDQNIKDMMETSLDGKSVSSFYKQASNGKIQGFKSTIYNLTASLSSCDFFTWTAALTKLATNQNIPIGTADRVIYIMPSTWSCMTAGGWGDMPGRTSWVVDRSCKSAYYHIVAHELGHNFGFHHSTNNGMTTSYSDSQCVMSANVYHRVNAAHIVNTKPDWIPSSNVQSVTGPGSYVLAPMALDATTSLNSQVMRLDNLVLSFRQKLGAFDSTLSGANLSIHTGGSAGMVSTVLAYLGAGQAHVTPDGKHRFTNIRIDQNQLNFDYNAPSESNPH